jgi:hypothetical protein
MKTPATSWLLDVGTRSSSDSSASQYSLGSRSTCSDMICPSFRKDPPTRSNPSRSNS